MRILHVYKDFDPPIHGGVEKHIALMCRYQRQWAEVRALTCSRSWRTREVLRDETPVLEVGEWGRVQSAPVAPAFPWHMRAQPADVVVVHVPNPTAEVGWLLARPRGKLVVRYHSDVVRQASAMRLYRPVQMTFLRQADMILPTSRPYLETSEMLRAVRERCEVVPLGIEPASFQHPNQERVAALRQKYGDPFVLFSGMHRYYKGLPYLIRAARNIGARVVAAGDGPERANAMRLSEQLDAEVVFPGRLSHEDLVAHLHACAVFVFPSIARSEAFGISIMEAHAAGKPVVATKLGTGVEYINEHEATGLNVPPENSDALAEAVNSLLADPTRRESMGAHARARIERDFEVEHVARREFELYQQVL